MGYEKRLERRKRKDQKEGRIHLKEVKKPEAKPELKEVPKNKPAPNAQK